MRLLALLSFIAYCTIILSPVVFAANDELKSSSAWCAVPYIYADSPDESAKKTWEALYNSAETKTKESNNTCGEPNSTAGGTLEKGDCTGADPGKIITEISEVIGENVVSGDNEIITVYKGVCCLIGKGTSTSIEECDDKRDVYFDTYDNCTAGAVACSKRQWIISTSGAGIIKVYVKQMYRWAVATVGFIAVATIVVSGIQISVSGVSGDITTAKNRILQSIGAIVLLFLSGLLLYTINPTFFS